PPSRGSNPSWSQTPWAEPPAACPRASCARRAYGLPACLCASAPPSPGDSRSAADVPARSAGSLTALRCLPRPALAPAATDRTRHDSPAPAHTCARYSGRLASALLPGSGRRCRPARAAAALAPSCDFLQGTFEKIYFHVLLRQHALQNPHLLAKLPYWRVRRPALDHLQVVPPVVQHRPLDPQLLRQLTDVLALLHALHRHELECPRILVHTLLRAHAQPLSRLAVEIWRVSF